MQVEERGVNAVIYLCVRRRMSSTSWVYAVLLIFNRHHLNRILPKLEHIQRCDRLVGILFVVMYSKRQRKRMENLSKDYGLLLIIDSAAGFGLTIVAENHSV